MNAEEKEFLRELSAMAQQLRRDIEAQQVGLDSSPEARAERRRRVLVDRDFEFFAYTYFPHHIRPPASLFHAHFFKRFPQLISTSSGLKEWWVAPRGEAKSSLLTKVGPCYVVVQGLLQRPEIRAELGMTGPAPYFVDYITLLGAETRLPTKLLEVVKTELLVNASLSLDFPEVCGKGSVWKIGEFVSLSGVKLEAFGAEQAIRGTFHGASRPKLLLGDDLITDKEAKSPTERNNRWDWLEKAIDYLGPPDGSVKYLGVGTVLNKDDPISRAKRTVGHLVHHFRAIETFPAHMDLWAHCEEVMLNDDKPVMEQYAERGSVAPDSALPSFQFYQDNREQMELGAVTSWPGVRSLYWLMRQRAKNKAAFATELQGDPRSDEDKTFTNPRFWVMRSGRWQMFGACDPSVGASAQSDPSAIIVGGWDTEKQVLNVIEAAIKRRVPSKLESDLIKAQREYQMRAIGFENNGAFEIQRQNIAKAALMQRVALPLVGVTSMADQSVRIDAMEPFINDAFAPRILFSPGLVALLDELDSWPEPQTGHHYDGLCALSILWMIASTRAGSYEFTPVPGRRSSADSSEFKDSFDIGGRMGGDW